MKISYNWLKDFIEINESPEEIADILTQTGLEVESIEKVEKTPGGLAGLIVGEVKTCNPHPNADKLKLTQVDIGGDQLLNIVCGAPNVAAGQKVVVAPIGTTIHPTAGEPFTIKRAKIRGEESEGMLCAEDEIGLGESHEGLLVLEKGLKVGTAVRAVFDNGEDFIFEIGLTPNRGDAASHQGTARDLKAFFNRPIKLPTLKAREKKEDQPVSVVVEDPKACPRYSGATIRGIDVGPSPDWLQWRLKSVGLSPINNVVDITNYVMMHLGQPMHAFDADKIAGGQVIVKTLPAGTPFTTLDEAKRTLHEKDLMICDKEGGMCMAGVFGGIGSGITETTTSIFLESAHFSADYVRATAMRHGLSTDASFRFERGTDPEMTIPALHLAVTLVLDICGGHLASDYLDIYPEPISPARISTSFQRFHQLIGKEIPHDRILEILNALDIATENIRGGAFTAVVPTYRSEVTREADLVEEVLRIYGFNNIELEETISAGYLASFPDKEPHKVYEQIAAFLAGIGFSEMVTNSLTNPTYQDLQPVEDVAPVEILNKSSEELGILKTTPLYTALECIRHNINRRQVNLKLFELTRVYRHDESYKERTLLTLYLSGQTHEESWIRPPHEVLFHDLMGVIHSLFHFLKIRNVSAVPCKENKFQYGVELFQGQRSLGKIGKLGRGLTKYFSVDQEVFYAEIDWKKLLQSYKSEVEFTTLSKFPEVKRDLSLVIDKQISFNEISDLAFKYEKKLLNRVNVFSVYEGENIGKDKKAYAISFFLQDPEKTLTDKIIDKVFFGLIEVFEKELGAIIRK